MAYVLNAGPDGVVDAQSVAPSFVGENGNIINDNAAVICVILVLLYFLFW